MDRPRLLTKIVLEEFRNTRPGIAGGGGLIDVGITITEEGMSGVGIDNDLVMNTDLAEQPVELFDGSDRD